MMLKITRVICTIKASPSFLSRIQIHTIQRIIIKFFIVIPDSFLVVLVAHSSKDMSNISTFSDFYTNMLLVYKHTI